MSMLAFSELESGRYGICSLDAFAPVDRIYVVRKLTDCVEIVGIRVVEMFGVRPRLALGLT